MKVYGNEDCGINGFLSAKIIVRLRVRSINEIKDFIGKFIYFLILVQKILYRKIRKHLGH